MRNYEHQAEGLEPTTDLVIEPGRITKAFQFPTAGKVPRGTAFLALALKGLDLSGGGLALTLNREPLGQAALHTLRGGWRSQVLSVPGSRLRKGRNEISLVGVDTGRLPATHPELPRMTVAVRLDSDV